MYVKRSSQGKLFSFSQGSHIFKKIIFHTFSILNLKSSMPLLLFIFWNY